MAWEKIENGSKIRREFTFKNFKEAIKFVNEVGDLAEQNNHHPDIAINYNKVTLTLTTHDEGKLTEKDFTLAQMIDELH